jgi:hypothetical protein
VGEREIIDSMKKLFPIIVFGILFCISVLFFLKYDSKRFDYGWNCDFCNKKLPYNLEHKFNEDDINKFCLLDEDDLELIGNGFKFYSSSFTIKNFIAYGFNDNSVVVKCKDSLNTIKYLISYETKYKSKKANPEISFKDLSNNDFEQVKEKYSWVVFNHEEAQRVTYKRFLSAIGAFFSLLLLIIFMFKLRI